MTHFNYYLNPEGSNYSFEDLRDILEPNFQMISQACSHTFSPITETESRDLPYPEKLIKFSPEENFAPGRLALASKGIDFNIEGVENYTLPQIRRLALHELGHNLGMGHVPFKESVMSVHEHRSPLDKSLLWRYDLIQLWDKAPKSEKPIGLVSVDADFNVMIPSIVILGIEMSIKLRYYPIGQFWMVSHSYTANDGVDMEERAELLTGDILELHNLSFLGWTIPVVRMQIYKEGVYWKTRLA